MFVVRLYNSVKICKIEIVSLSWVIYDRTIFINSVKDTGN